MRFPQQVQRNDHVESTVKDSGLIGFVTHSINPEDNAGCDDSF